ncbi:MAG: hypothetical protein GXO47_13755 [Chlorobi bacterium]|nr:hypothetical protein [Chlorobiota bacterium]
MKIPLIIENVPKVVIPGIHPKFLWHNEDMMKHSHHCDERQRRSLPAVARRRQGTS